MFSDYAYINELTNMIQDLFFVFLFAFCPDWPSIRFFSGSPVDPQEQQVLRPTSNYGVESRLLAARLRQTYTQQRERLLYARA